MKNLFKLAVLSSVLALTSVSVAHAEEKIGFLDSNYIMQVHQPTRNAIEKMKADFQVQIDILGKQKKVIENKQNALKKDAPKLRAVDIKKREEEINKLNLALQKEAKELKAKAAKRANEETHKASVDIKNAVAKVAKQGNYTLVLEARSVAFATKGKDITDEVIKNLSRSTSLPSNTQKKPTK